MRKTKTVSESNGYATASVFRGAPKERRLADEEIDGHKFRLQSWTSLESAQWRARNESEPETSNERAIILTCADPNGGMLFGEADIKMLQEMDAGFINSLANACIVHAAGNIETKKNSKPTP